MLIGTVVLPSWLRAGVVALVAVADSDSGADLAVRVLPRSGAGVPAEQNTMVSPADGKVSDITEIENDPLLGGPAVRVGIFLSVFNVHVNRSPCDGTVVGCRITRRGSSSTR